MSFRLSPRRLALAVLLAATSNVAFAAPADDAVFRLPDHYEFDATLDIPFQPDAHGEYRAKLGFHYPAGGDSTIVAWQLELLTPAGELLRQIAGETGLEHGRGRALAAFDGLDAALQPLPAGFYTVRLRAVPGVVLPQETRRAERIARSFALAPDEVIEQTYDIRVGEVPAPAMPAFAGLPRGREKAVAATASLPYTIYYGNLHSQTNHSDGGAPVASCSGSQGPQAGQFGPADAYAMMDVQAGGDFLLASEHNHMYDGSTSTNTSASPAAANNLFASGLSAAATYNSAYPDFLALYGNEWGVISNGGHLNIVNPDALPNWEYTSGGQLIGGVATIKSDYAHLYSVMKARGWIGQFNHPSSSQFLVGGVGMGYHADGAEVMVLAEIMNTSAFSTNTSQTETSKSTYTGAFNLLLERGFRVAPATNQDNHCANWGLSSPNRTGVLLSNALALNQANFIDALKARRVFASEDKTAQLILTLNGHVMGQSLATSGAVTLAANYASSSGGTVSRVQFFEGVPRRDGTVTQLFEGAGTYTFTPADGQHFYYALVTEADGDRLWSAPIWITQGAAPSDITPPSVSASESGSSGTITLSATASDNVGVTRVEFLVDGVLKGTDTTSPYSMTLDSTTLSNGTHTLTATAADAAGNTATSPPVSFSISNTVADTTPPSVSASESGSSGTITLSATASDNVGVTRVEFLVDGVLKGTDTTSPYSMTLDSTTLSNGTHTLTATAADAAGNTATSAPVSFSISNTVATPVELITNGGYESGRTGWTATNKNVVTRDATYAAHGGLWKAWLNGYGSANTEYVFQSVSIPSATTTATLKFWLRVDSDETSTTQAWDTLKVEIRNSSNAVLATLATYSNLNESSSYSLHSFDVSAYKGQTIRVYFQGTEGSQTQTSFLIDDVSLVTQ